MNLKNGDYLKNGNNGEKNVLFTPFSTHAFAGQSPDPNKTEKIMILKCAAWITQLCNDLRHNQSLFDT